MTSARSAARNLEQWDTLSSTVPLQKKILAADRYAHKRRLGSAEHTPSPKAASYPNDGIHFFHLSTLLATMEATECVGVLTRNSLRTSTRPFSDATSKLGIGAIDLGSKRQACEMPG
jgi:hypothetical protein